MGMASVSQAAPVTGTNGGAGSDGTTAAGGTGGDGSGATGSGGAGSTTNVGGNGAAGSNGSGGGGGGGGLNLTFSPVIYPVGGAGGGNEFGTGGNGGTQTAAPQGGGEEAGGGGGFGGSASGSGAGGGGGGGGRGATISADTATISVTDLVTGGNGGNGGVGVGPYGDGGGGGGGGIGVVFTGTGTLTVDGTITGGSGGNGGDAPGTGTFGGSGGAGGTGLRAVQPGATVIVNADITGGQGGAIGAGQWTPTRAVPGAGGAGIVGSGVTIIGGASISGGLGGDGTTRANSITFTGGTNTLTLDSGWGLVGNIGIVGAATTATFRQTTIDAAVATVITGDGALIVDDGGSGRVMTLTGINSYTGSTSVNAGSLIVNGSIAASSGVFVNAGGVLGGNGTVAATTINSGGTLAPGNAMGLLTVNGNLTLNAGANYDVEVSPTSATRTDVIGIATLGGTVNATFATGPYTSKQYTILNATDGLSGSFSGLSGTSRPVNFGAALSYDDNNVYLNLALIYTSAVNANQKNVGNALIRYFDTHGGIATAFTALSANGLSQVAGEPGASLTQPLFNDAGQFINAVFGNAFGGFGSEQRGRALGFASADDGAAFGDASTSRLVRKANDIHAAAMPKDARLRDPEAPRWSTSGWSTWATAYGGNSRVEGDAATGSNATQSRVYGVVAGASYLITPNAIVGFATGGSSGRFAIDNGFGGGNADTFHTALYGRNTFGHAYVSGLFGYGWHALTTDRIVTAAGSDRLRTDVDAHSFNGRFETGYRMGAGSFGIAPYLAGQVTAIYLPAYSEAAHPGSDQFALSYGSRTAIVARSELGLRFDDVVATADGALKLKGRLAWAHDEGNAQGATATFQTLPGATFTVNGVRPAANTALLSAGAEYEFGLGWSVGASFDGELSRNAASYNGRGMLRHVW